MLHTARCIALTVCAHRQNNTYADDHLLLVINVLFKNLDTHIRKCRENSVDFSPSLHDENDGGLQNATADAKCQCCQLKDFNMDMVYSSDGMGCDQNLRESSMNFINDNRRNFL